MHSNEAALYVDGTNMNLVLPAAIVYGGKVYALAATARGGLVIRSATPLDVEPGIVVEIGGVSLSPLDPAVMSS